MNAQKNDLIKLKLHRPNTNGCLRYELVLGELLALNWCYQDEQYKNLVLELFFGLYSTYILLFNISWYRPYIIYCIVYSVDSVYYTV